MKVIAGTILGMLALVMFFVVGAAAWSMNGMITDNRQYIAATTACNSGGVSFSVFKDRDRKNSPCDDRELSRLMLLSGLEDQARFNQCSMPDALRKYATVENCLNYNAYGAAKVISDVHAKAQRCGGEPKPWQFWKRNKYRKCMESLI